MDPQDFISDLIGFWRGDAFAADVLSDLSGSGNDLSCVGVSAGVTSTANGWGSNGVPIVTTSGFGARYARAASKAPWKPLSSGTGVTFWAVIRAEDSAGTGSLFDTGVSPTNVGAHIRTLIDKSAINFEITNGLGDGYVIDYVGGKWFSWDDSFSYNEPHLLILTFDAAQIPNIQIWLDGVLIGQLNTNDRVKEGAGRPLSNADPTDFFQLFSAINGTSAWNGECAEVGVSGSALTPEIRSQLQAYVQSRYTLRIKQSKPGVLVWDGNSLVDSFWRDFQFPQYVTPQLKQRTFNNMRAIAGLTIEQMILRAPTEVIPNYDPTALFNVLIAWEFVNSIAEGATAEEAYDLYVQYCQMVRTVSTPFKLIVVPLLPEIYATPADAEYINTRLIDEWPGFADGIARPDLDPILGSWPAMYADWDGGAGPKIYRSDGVHFTALGNQRLVPYFRDALNAQMPGRILIGSVP